MQLTFGLRRIRVDQLIVERGLVASRQQAQAMVMAGEVLVNEQKADKPGRLIARDASIRLLQQQARFVSRGGEKLAAAMAHFEIDVAGAACLDIGASTGGFTDCLLQFGAARVHAVDVGTNQLHWALRNDGRVHVLEQCNARYLTQAHLGERVSFACCDVSFISVTKILPRLEDLLAPGSEAVVLAKPQFEVGKGEVGKGGVVRDHEMHMAVVESVRGAMLECGFDRVDWMDSPLLGASGNREFLLHGTTWRAPSTKGVE
ncbi:MAG: TlyA family RNA methyltransferase [Bryobacterales bacterium]|nr:TlyA family RNA methyltransferase [Bryobacterales bacterium]